MNLYSQKWVYEESKIYQRLIEATKEGEQMEIMETEGRKRPAGARELTCQKWGSVQHGC